jgi:threonine/homoserine/homoserine lactone efflux protein
MSLLSIFLVSFTIALSGAMMPGPLLTVVIAESMKHGKKTGPLVTLGHALLEVLTLILLLFSFNQLVHNPLVLKVIAALGSLILLSTGIQMLASLRKLEVELKAAGGKASGLVFTGFWMSAVNPYFAIWWLTIGLGLILSAQKAGWLAVIFFFFGHICADLAWFTFISYTVSRGRNYLSGPLYRGVIAACAIVLIIFSCYFGISIVA